MKKEREFYPMITGTLKTLLPLVEFGDEWQFIKIIVTYPNYELDQDLAINPIALAVINELDRQYARWNKGGDNATK